MKKLLLEVHYKIKNGKRAEFYRELSASGIAEASQAEAGNFKYEYFYTADSDDEICLFEMWENEEFQKLHLNTEHYKKLAALKEQYVSETSIQRFYVSDC